jgi:hypothetical protein
MKRMFYSLMAVLDAIVFHLLLGKEAPIRRGMLPSMLGFLWRA